MVEDIILGQERVKVENVIHLIKSAGHSLGLFSITITRAMILCHHFKRCVGNVEYDDGLTAAAALSLSAKVSDDQIEKTSVVDFFWRVFRDDKPDAKSDEFNKMAQSIRLMQYVFCRMLKFSFDYKLAHEYLVPVLRDLHNRKEFQRKWGYFCSVVWRAVSTMYETRRCLDYEASEIATACISFACLMCEIRFSPSKGWQQGLSISANEEKCKKICADILLACYKSSS